MVDLLLGITISFITIALIVLLTMKKSMESKLAFITENVDDVDNTTKAKSIIRWIAGTTAWGIVSMLLIVLCFHYHYG